MGRNALPLSHGASAYDHSALGAYVMKGNLPRINFTFGERKPPCTSHEHELIKDRDRLLNALEPFARVAEDIPLGARNDDIFVMSHGTWGGTTRVVLTVGRVRKAHEVYMAIVEKP